MQNDLPFVETYRLNQFQFTAPILYENEKDVLIKDVSKWNCDGEIIKTQAIKAK